MLKWLVGETQTESASQTAESEDSKSKSNGETQTESASQTAESEDSKSKSKRKRAGPSQRVSSQVNSL